MQLSHALDIINLHAPSRIDSLHDLLPADLISQALAQTDTVTFRKRKLPLESMVWLLIGMAIYNDKSMATIVNTMDIVNSDSKPFVASSAVIQRRQSLGEDAVRLHRLAAAWLDSMNVRASRPLGGVADGVGDDRQHLRGGCAAMPEARLSERERGEDEDKCENSFHGRPHFLPVM